MILISYAQMSDAEVHAYEPTIVRDDARNRIMRIGNDPAEALAPSERATLPGDRANKQSLRA